MGNRGDQRAVQQGVPPNRLIGATDQNKLSIVGEGEEEEEEVDRLNFPIEFNCCWSRYR